MALEVPITNRKIPEGFRPEDLGNVTYANETNNLFVIDSFGPDIYLNCGFNQYALFDIHPSDNQILSVRWRFRLGNSNENEQPQELTLFNDKFTATIDPNLLSITEAEKLTLIVVVKKEDNTEATIIISNNIYISEELEFPNIGNIAFRGNNLITRLLLNNYSKFINEATRKNHPLIGSVDDIPELLLAGYVAFQIAISHEVSLDHEFEQKQPIGVCRLLPDLIDILENENTNLDEYDKINLLRFPKSNIHLCTHILSKIKEKCGYSEITRNDLIDNKKAVIHITETLCRSCTSGLLNQYPSLNYILTILRGLIYLPRWEYLCRYGRRIHIITGTPWCRALFYGKKTIKGRIINDNGSNLPLNNVRVDVFWDITKVSQCLIENTNDDYSKTYRIRIIANNEIIANNGLRLFNSANTIDPYENIRVQPWQVFRLLEIIETTDENDRITVWYKIEYQHSNYKWIVASCNNITYAEVERVVQLTFNDQIRTNQQGEFSFIVYDIGFYFIRTVKEDRYNDQETRDYYDGEYGWFRAIDMENFLPPLLIPMQSEEANVRWVRESEIVGRIRAFENWTYRKKGARFPSILGFENKSPREHFHEFVFNENQPHSQSTAGTYTNCNTYCEVLLIDTWNTLHTDFNWNRAEHNLWMNNAGLNINNRLRIIEPGYTKRIGRWLYAVERNNQQNIINGRIFSNNVDSTTPYPTEHDVVRPEPWTVVQWYNNYFDDNVTEPIGTILSGHMVIFLDYDRETDRILILQASSNTSKRPNGSNASGPQVTGLYHADCLIECMLQQNDNFTTTQIISKEWKTSDTASTWAALKMDKRGLAMIKLFVYDLRLTRPPARRRS
jgi:hypothetical protein